MDNIRQYLKNGVAHFNHAQIPDYKRFGVEIIKKGGKVRIKNINKMWGLGTPEDLNNFMNNYNGQY